MVYNIQWYIIYTPFTTHSWQYYFPQNGIVKPILLLILVNFVYKFTELWYNKIYIMYVDFEKYVN